MVLGATAAYSVLASRVSAAGGPDSYGVCTRLMSLRHLHQARAWSFSTAAAEPEGLEASLNVTLDWAETHGVLLAFPQGQSLQTCVSPPCKAYTWSNYVMDSGQDDVAFWMPLRCTCTILLPPPFPLCR